MVHIKDIRNTMIRKNSMEMTIPIEYPQSLTSGQKWEVRYLSNLGTIGFAYLLPNCRFMMFVESLKNRWRWYQQRNHVQKPT